MLKINTDKKQLDLEFIYQFLSKTYWAKERTKKEIQKSINNSLCFGMYIDNKQIGFARVITDNVVFSYLLDVFIDKKYQGKKYGKKLLTKIYSHADLTPVRSHYLHTKDAQKFYKKNGFEIYGTPEKFMIKKKNLK